MLTYAFACRWDSLFLGRLSRFTIDCKGPPSARLEYHFTTTLSSSESVDADAGAGRGEAAWVGGVKAGAGDKGEEGDVGESVGSCLMSDYQFVCWMMGTLGAPTGGLLVSCRLAPTLVYACMRALVESGFRAVNCVPTPARVLLLRALAVLVRGLWETLTLHADALGLGSAGSTSECDEEYGLRGRRLLRDLSKEAAATVRVLREAAILQYAVELPQVLTYADVC